jgi:hypothetical protein
MSNTILTPTAVTREALRVLHQELTFIGSINRQYDDSFAKSGAKIGDTLKIRLPNQYTVRTGRTIDVQDTTESSVSLQVATQKGVDLNFTSDELTLSMDDFSTRVLKPAMAVLAASMEADALNMRKDVYQQVDNTAAAITFAKVLQGRKKMNDSLAPSGDRTALLNGQDNANLVDVLKGLFQDSTNIAKQYREGYMGRTGGFDFMESTHLTTQARGAGDTGYTTDTRTSALATDGTAYSQITVASGTGALNVGEIITITDLNSVHPETKVTTGIAQQFVVTEAYSGGAGTLKISPSIILGGAKQNVVTAATGATKAIAISGTASTAYGQSLLYHKDAFTFATADLVMPKGVDFAAREVFDGVSIRVVRQYDINNDAFPCRLDVMYGYKTIRPQLAARLANSATA